MKKLDIREGLNAYLLAAREVGDEFLPYDHELI